MTPRAARKTERARLQADLHRAHGVLDAIDTATNAHLCTEFERRFQALQQAGNQPDPRDAQITRFKNEITMLKRRLAESTSTIEELTGFRAQALARLAAQHDEITRLRATLGTVQPVRHLHTRNRISGPRS